MPARDPMLGVLRHLRATKARALEGRELTGTAIDPDAASGRCGAAWLHASPAPGPRPLVVELHGGGFALGDARSGDALRSWISASFGAHVVGVDYRLAPEHPAPAQLEDALGALEHVAAGAAGVSVDPDRIVLIGFSAGAAIAAAAALAAPERVGLKAAGIALHYPYLDAAPPAAEEEGEGLPGEVLAAFRRWYLSGGADPADPLVSPLHASDGDLSLLGRVALCPVEGDPLLVQAEALRDRLDAIGAPVTWHLARGVYHGYVEDAIDLATYRATTPAESIEARSPLFTEEAAFQVRRSLEDLLGPARPAFPFPGTEEMTS